MEYTTCAICNLDETRRLFTAYDYITGDKFEIVSCTRCGLTYVNPRPDDKEIEKYYPPSYYGKRRSIIDIITIWCRIKRIEIEVPGDEARRILDIGCGSGRMLREMRKRGWDVFGTELSEYSCKRAKEEFNLDVRKGSVETCNFPENYFDVITLWHVFEHIKNPSETLNEIYRLLKRDGVLIIDVPNLKSLQFMLSRERWFHLDVPRHLYNFTTTTLANLLNKNEFKVYKVKQSSFEYDFFGMIQSILNVISHRQNLLFDLIMKRVRLKDILLSKDVFLYRDLLFLLFIFPPGLIFSIITSCISRLFGLGGDIEVYAKKGISYRSQFSSPFCMDT
ncbi:MAG TPA: class I SAM-dependent methyltransferase [Candidatus Brocadiia bacterium]|nr:class I SAM-dependent methyltransferase [Candidatus Brocadiales bacterium]